MPGVLKRTRGAFNEWRKRHGLDAGIYGIRIDAGRPVVLLAVPLDARPPSSSRAFEASPVATDMTADEFIDFLVGEYLREVLECRTDEELGFVLSETKGRRRFQGFGKSYGEPAPRAQGAGSEPHETDKPLRRVSGGSFRARMRTGAQECPLCGGELEEIGRRVPVTEADEKDGVFVWRPPPIARIA
jgi:hypothetical protein